MTTYTALGGDWGTPSDWAENAVPNSPDADVLLSGPPNDIAVTLAANESYAVRSLFLDDAVLTIDGALAVSQSVTMNQGSTLTLGGGALTADDVVVGSVGDTLSGWGTINGAVVDNGTILAGVHSDDSYYYDDQLYADDLVINGDVSGAGVLEIAGGVYNPYYYEYSFPIGGEIEINGTSANDVVFTDGVGTLQLDKPSAYTGTLSVTSLLVVEAFYSPDYASFNLNLEGVSLSSVTGYAYSGGSSGGVLTIDTTAGNYSYKFAGLFETSDFELSAQASGGSGLVVTVTPKPIISGTVGGQQITSSQTLAPFADILISDPFASSQNNADAEVSFSGGSGTWSNLGAGFLGGDGSYFVNGDPASITAALQALVFTPTPDNIVAGTTETLTFTVTYSDYLEPTVTDSTTTVVVAATTMNIAQSGVTIDADNSLITFTAAADGDTIVGDDDTIVSPSGKTLTVSGVGDAVYLSSGRVYLEAGANVSIVGGDDLAIAAGDGDVVGFVGVGDVAQISHGTVYLGGASNVVIVGDDDVANAGVVGDVMGFVGTGDVAEISNGTVYLGGASNVVIVGDDDVANAGVAGAVMGFVGIGDLAEISNGTVYLGAGSNVVIMGGDDVANSGTAGNVMGFVGADDVAEISNGTVYLGAASSVKIVGSDDVANTAAAGDVMTFLGVNDIAEITDGTVFLGLGSSVTILGDNDLAHADAAGATMNLTGARDTAEISNGIVGLQNASVALVGANDTINLAHGFGLNTLSGFGPSDQLQFSRQDFASASAVLSAAATSGGDTVITLDAGDTLRLAGLSLSSLAASQIAVV